MNFECRDYVRTISGISPSVFRVDIKHNYYNAIEHGRLLSKEMHQSEASVCQQTGALLYKNVLIKWRNKKQSVQEWLLCLVVLLLGWLLMFVVEENHARLPEMPENDLDRLDAFNVTTRVIGYAPQTQFAKEIMEKVALTLNGTGVKIEEYKDDMALKEAWSKDDQLLGIVFKDSFSYEIRISKWNVPLPFNEFEDFAPFWLWFEHCNMLKCPINGKKKKSDGITKNPPEESSNENK